MESGILLGIALAVTIVVAIVHAMHASDGDDGRCSCASGHRCSLDLHCTAFAGLCGPRISTVRRFESNRRALC